MIEVSSSNIESVDYESGILYVKFLNGGLYAYYRVPYGRFVGLMNADSVGGYLAEYIKPYYDYRRIR